MQSDYMYMNDIIYTINEDIKVVFHTVASFTNNNTNKTYSNCTEFKINSNQTCNTMIRRNISYYLFIDDKRSGRTEKICIYPEHMFTLLDIFQQAKQAWFGVGTNHIYAYLDNRLTIISDESLFIKLPLDKVIKIAPGVMKKESGDCPCVDLYLNSPEVVQISIDTFNGLFYVLSTLDMLNYANTSLTFMMLRNEPVNRIDYSNSSNNQVSTSDSSTASGSIGRTFNVNNNSKGSILN